MQKILNDPEQFVDELLERGSSRPTRTGSGCLIFEAASRSNPS
jgi:hypothetical protein